MESLESAKRRKVEVLGEIKAAYQNSDSYHIVKPCADGIADCMGGVLREGGLNPKDIDVIQCHGTGTLLNDKAEWKAIGKIWQKKQESIRICAIKGQIGHTIGASGSLAVAAALGSIQCGNVYPIPNYEALEHDSNGKPMPRIENIGQIDKSITNVVVNAFAFGGTNVCLLVSRFEG